MKAYLILACLMLSIPFVTDWAVDRAFAKHPQPVEKRTQPVGYTVSEASEPHKLQDAALHHRMTTGEKLAALKSLFGEQL